MVKRAKNEVYRIDNYGDIDTWDIINGLKGYCKSRGHDLDSVEEALYELEISANRGDEFAEALYKFLIDASGVYDFSRVDESRKVKESTVDFVENYDGYRIYKSNGRYTVDGVPKFNINTYVTDYVGLSSDSLEDLKNKIDKAERKYRQDTYSYID